MENKFDYFSDVVEMLIDDEDKHLGDKFVINEDKIGVVKELCNAVAKLEEEIKFEEFNAGFNDTTGYLEFKIITEYFSIKSCDSGFYTLLKNSLKFRINSVERGETVSLYFAFNNVWDIKE